MRISFIKINIRIKNITFKEILPNMKTSPLDRKIIALTGMMGSGKTHIGKRLATLMKVDFIDSDFEIEKSEKFSINKIFSQKGEKYFRKVEKNKIAEIFYKTKKVSILSLGGGAIVNLETLELLKNNAILIWVEADIYTLAGRLKNRKNRPLLQEDNLEKNLDKILQERSSLYDQAHIKINSNNKISEEFLYGVLQKIQNFNL
jgi:shikimate kinase